MTAVILNLPFQADWFSIVLILCFATAFYTYGIKALFSWQSWLALLLFFTSVLSSNTWRFVPEVAEELKADPEAQRIWFRWATEWTYQAKMMIRNLAVGMCVILSLRFKNTAPTLTLTILFVWFVAETGESVERFVCKMNDPAFGLEHEWRATGDTRPTCRRAFGGFGGVIFPLLTVTPLPVILAVTYYKRKGRPV